MSFRVSVPENVGGELKVLGEGTCTAQIADIFLGESATKNPKATVKYIVTSEFAEGSSDDPIIGEVVLETFSLQPQAIFRINDLYKQATNERIPQGDFDQAEFETLLKEALIGSDWVLELETEEDPNGNPRTQVAKRVAAPKTGKKKPKK